MRAVATRLDRSARSRRAGGRRCVRRLDRARLPAHSGVHTLSGRSSGDEVRCAGSCTIFRPSARVRTSATACRVSRGTGRRIRHVSVPACRPAGLFQRFGTRHCQHRSQRSTAASARTSTNVRPDRGVGDRLSSRQACREGRRSSPARQWPERPARDATARRASAAGRPTTCKVPSSVVLPSASAVGAAIGPRTPTTSASVSWRYLTLIHPPRPDPQVDQPMGQGPQGICLDQQ
jgi:hypothetical protein